MTKATNKQAKHMKQNATRTGAKRGKAGIVALALAGVLAVGGVSAVCVAGLGKSPGQQPAAVTQVAQPATKVTKAAAKPEQKQADKPATQQEAAKPAQQQDKPAQQQQQAQPQQTVKAEQSNDISTWVKVSREGAIGVACSHTGAGGAAKGEAMNVVARGPIEGGGTVYYVVELDLGEVHYSVTVDATTGNVINADQTHNGVRTLLDENGDPQEGTEWPVDA